MKSLLFILFLAMSACHQGATGTLVVHALKEGEFEVYKILGDSTLQFVSNQIGRLNTSLSLQVGNYLILGDCSHHFASIHPNKTTDVIAHSLVFIPPRIPEANDLFTIQCNRHPKTHAPQQILSRFELTIFPGKVEMLVGMKPMSLDLNTEIYKAPQILSFDLAATQVAGLADRFPIEASPYFLSPKDAQISVTQRQDCGKWQFVLPGTYLLTVNGSEREISIQPKEALAVKPFYFIFTSSGSVDLSRYQAIKGEPYTIEINDKRAFSVNVAYPLISPSVTYRLDGESKGTNLQLKPQELTTVELRSVEVSLNCGPWEWECLGKRDVSLFEPGSPYPFLHGSTDLPILYSRDEVEIELEGAQSLRYRIPKTKRDSSFETGQIILRPRPLFRPGQLSLLVRIEGDSSGVFGQSYDIPYARETRMSLISGDYRLNHFFVIGSHLQTGGSQGYTKSSFSIRKGDIREQTFDYFVSEDKFETISANLGTASKARTSSRDRPFQVY